MSARDGAFDTVLLTARSARVCPTCGALVYNRDDAEQAHRRFHDSLITTGTWTAEARALRANP